MRTRLGGRAGEQVQRRWRPPAGRARSRRCPRPGRPPPARCRIVQAPSSSSSSTSPSSAVSRPPGGRALVGEVVGQVTALRRRARSSHAADVVGQLAVRVREAADGLDACPSRSPGSPTRHHAWTGSSSSCASATPATRLNSSWRATVSSSGTSRSSPARPTQRDRELERLAVQRLGAIRRASSATGSAGTLARASASSASSSAKTMPSARAASYSAPRASSSPVAACSISSASAAPRSVSTVASP